MRIRKAEEHEREQYTGLYSLFGYVVGVPAILASVKTTYTIPVEYLGEGRGKPNYEAIIPSGLHLSGDVIHTVLAPTQKELLERLASGLEECGDFCRELTTARENTGNWPI